MLEYLQNLGHTYGIKVGIHIPAPWGVRIDINKASGKPIKFKKAIEHGIPMIIEFLLMASLI